MTSQGTYEEDGDDVMDEETPVRRLLYKYWSRWGRWYKQQPLDAIRYSLFKLKIILLKMLINKVLARS